LASQEHVEGIAMRIIEGQLKRGLDQAMGRVAAFSVGTRVCRADDQGILLARDP
jgi:hypothetical protein